MKWIREEMDIENNKDVRFYKRSKNRHEMKNRKEERMNW